MKPINRHEVFLDALAKGEAANLEPATREEMFLKQIAEREASGGSGGGIVVNFTVDRDYALTEYSPFDFEEIKATILSGVYVVALQKNAVGAYAVRTVESFSDAAISFNFSGYLFTLFSDNTVSFVDVSNVPSLG